MWIFKKVRSEHSDFVKFFSGFFLGSVDEHNCGSANLAEKVEFADVLVLLRAVVGYLTFWSATATTAGAGLSVEGLSSLLVIESPAFMDVVVQGL